MRAKNFSFLSSAAEKATKVINFFLTFHARRMPFLDIDVYCQKSSAFETEGSQLHIYGLQKTEKRKTKQKNFIQQI